MDKIKVLVEGIKPIVGGRETYIMTQYECIDKNKFQYDFVFTSHKPFPEKYKEEIEKNGSHIFYLRNIKEWNAFFKVHDDYDFFISNNCGFSESIYYYPYLKGFSSFKKIIIHSHIAKEYPFKGIDKIVHTIESVMGKILFRKRNIIKWACSDIAGKWVFGENADFEIIKNGIFTEKFAFNENWRKEIRHEFNVADSDFLIGNVGRIHDQKNQDFLLDVLKKIKKLIPNAKLIIVGPIHQKNLFKKLQKKTNRYGLSSSVIFTGARSDTNKFYSAFDVFAFPSKYEGLGIVGLEAEAAGLPCLFSDTIPKVINIRKPYCKFLPIPGENNKMSNLATERWGGYS